VLGRARKKKNKEKQGTNRHGVAELLKNVCGDAPEKRKKRKKKAPTDMALLSC
jgi:hypothetical protein